MAGPQVVTGGLPGAMRTADPASASAVAGVALAGVLVVLYRRSGGVWAFAVDVVVHWFAVLSKRTAGLECPLH